MHVYCCCSTFILTGTIFHRSCAMGILFAMPDMSVIALLGISCWCTGDRSWLYNFISLLVFSGLGELQQDVIAAGTVPAFQQSPNIEWCLISPTSCCHRTLSFHWSTTLPAETTVWNLPVGWIVRDITWRDWMLREAPVLSVISN